MEHFIFQLVLFTVKLPWRREVVDQTCLVSLPKSRSNRTIFEANDVRNTFKEYFNCDDGTLPWQIEYVELCWHNPVSR